MDFLLNMGWVVYYHFARWVNAWKTSGQPRINGLNYLVENVIKQFIHASAVLYRDMKHLGSLESTQEARVAFGFASSNSYASFVLSKLPACFISR